MSAPPYTVTVLGAGAVGRALAARWRDAGLPVTVAVRHPAHAKHDPYRGAHAFVALDALPPADATVLALPGTVLPDVLDRHSDVLDGRLLVDATNLLGGDSLHQLPLIAQRLPGARTFRAFSCVGWENFTASVAGEQPDMPFCGPDGPDRATVAALIGLTGMRPVWLGDGTAVADALDGLARLWFALALGRGLGRRLAFRVLAERDLS